MLIDSHSHFDHRRFDQDRPDVWQRAQDAGVTAQIVPAVTAADWQRLKETCASFAGLYPAYGLHPMFCHEHKDADLQLLADWIEQEQPVAIGECGLDFYIDNPNRERQLELFEAQLEIARVYNLPVIIHARKAVEDVIITLQKYPGLIGVLHSYSGSLQQANRLIDMGFLVSFGGPVTYPNANRLHQLVAALPLESIMLESDSPDQPDVEHRGQRNEPSYLQQILHKISEIREEPVDVIAAQTTSNAQRLFGIEI
jgi:TatD DNase family protein